MAARKQTDDDLKVAVLTEKQIDALLPRLAASGVTDGNEAIRLIEWLDGALLEAELAKSVLRGYMTARLPKGAKEPKFRLTKGGANRVTRMLEKAQAGLSEGNGR